MAGNDIYLYAGEATAADVRLRDPNAAASDVAIISCVGITSAEAFGQPVVSSEQVAGAWDGWARRRHQLPLAKTQPVHQIACIGMPGREGIGHPLVIPGPLSPAARRRKDETELLLLAA